MTYAVTKNVEFKEYTKNSKYFDGVSWPVEGLLITGIQLAIARVKCILYNSHTQDCSGFLP